MEQKIQKRVGKAQAREEFSSLIESVASGAGPVEITDYGKVAAILLSEREYEWLCTCARKSTRPKRDPRGFFVLKDEDALESASKKIRKDFDSSIAKTAESL